MASEDELLDDEEAQPESLPAVKRAVAKESDGPLGLLLSGVPPGYVDVTDVKQGSWAERMGISEGDVLIEVNDDDLEDMLEDDFKTHFMARPLALTFQAASDSAADEADNGGTNEDDNEATTKSLLAGEDTQDLGLQLSGSPPGYLQVLSVQPQSLAWNSGIEAGDFLVEVNGADLESMTAQTFLRHYNDRPLRATFQHPQASSEEDEQDDELARLLQPLQAAPRDEQLVEQPAAAKPDGTAESVADLMEDTSGTGDADTSKLHNRAPDEKELDPAKLATKPNEASEADGGPDVGTEHNTDDEAKPAEDSPEVNDILPFEKHVVAEECDAKLGLILSGMPPGYLEVTGTREGSWAETAGLAAGDLLFWVNGEDLENMSAEIFKAHLTSRPLRMRFQAADQGSDSARADDGKDEADEGKQPAPEEQDDEKKPLTQAAAPQMPVDDAGAREQAALKIQSIGRGKAARMEAESRRQRKLEVAEEAERLQKEEAQRQQKEELDGQQNEELERHQAATRIQSSIRARTARQEAESRRKQQVEAAEEALVQRKEEAALQIQTALRGKRAKREASSRREDKKRAADTAQRQKEDEAAVQIQSAVRGKTARCEAASKRQARKEAAEVAKGQRKDEAALQIQSAVRGKTARREAASRRQARKQVKQEVAQQDDPELRELAELHTQLERRRAEGMELRKRMMSSPAYELQVIKKEVETQKACVHDLERAYVRQATLANVLVEYKDAADVRRECAEGLARSSPGVEEAVQAALQESRRIGQQHWECMCKTQEVAEMQLSRQKVSSTNIGRQDRLVLEEVTALLAQLRNEEERSYHLAQGMEQHAEEVLLQQLHRQLQSEKVAARQLAKRVDAEMAACKGLDLLEVRCERMRTSVWNELPHSLRSGLEPKRVHEAEDRLEACHLHALVLAEEASCAGAQRQAAKLQHARHELAEQEQEVERLRCQARLDRGSRKETWQETIRHAAADEEREEARLKREFRSMRASNRLLSSEIQEQMVEKSKAQAQQAHVPEAKTKHRGWFR